MTAGAPEVLFRFPAVLKMVVERDRLRVRGGTLPEALEAAYEALPNLRHHLAQDSGELRPHVLCVVNGEAVPREEVAGRKLQDGDEILIHQAISGG